MINLIFLGDFIHAGATVHVICSKENGRKVVSDSSYLTIGDGRHRQKANEKLPKQGTPLNFWTALHVPYHSSREIQHQAGREDLAFKGSKHIVRIGSKDLIIC